MCNDKTANKCDTVIIGSGIGGLIAGIEFAKAGLNTVIIEQHFQAGGCCTSFKRKGFVFDAGAHIFGGVGNKKSPIGYYLANLDIGIDYIKFDPMDLISFPDFSIEIPADVDSFITNLIEHFPEEENNIIRFFKVTKKLFLFFGKPEHPLLLKYKNSTYQEMLDDFFKSKKLKSVLSAQWGYIGVQPEELSAIAMCLTLSSYLFCGAYFPKGGSGAFANALQKKFEQLGGKIYLSSKVDKIIVNNSKAEGVVLNNNRQILKADYIISNADAKHTFMDLIGSEYIDYEYLDRISKMKESIQLFITYLGVDIEKDELINKSGWHYDSDDINNKDNIPLFVGMPTLLDSSLAPKNKHIIEIYTKIPNNAIRTDKYKEDKKDFENKLIDRFEKVIPGLRSRIIYKESATSKTVKRYTSNSNGVAYGWAPVPEQSWMNCLPNETPVENLHLTGHWSYPGAGVMAVFNSGLITARRILSTINN